MLPSRRHHFRSCVLRHFRQRDLRGRKRQSVDGIQDGAERGRPCSRPQHPGPSAVLPAREMTGTTLSPSFSALLRSSLYRYLHGRGKALQESRWVWEGALRKSPKARPRPGPVPAPHTDRAAAFPCSPARCRVLRAALHTDWHSQGSAIPPGPHHLSEAQLPLLLGALSPRHPQNTSR